MYLKLHFIIVFFFLDFIMYLIITIYISLRTDMKYTSILIIIICYSILFLESWLKVPRSIQMLHSRRRTKTVSCHSLIMNQSRCFLFNKVLLIYPFVCTVSPEVCRIYIGVLPISKPDQIRYIKISVRNIHHLKRELV